jgi:hypothetical protein
MGSRSRHVQHALHAGGMMRAPHAMLRLLLPGLLLAAAPALVTASMRAASHQLVKAYR